MKIFIKLIICFFWLSEILGFYVHDIKIHDQPDQETDVIKNFKININKDDLNFPNKFSVNFNHFGENFEAVYLKSKTDHKSDIYVIGEGGNPVKYNLYDQEEFQNYYELNGDGYSTLIKNKENNPNEKFRMIGRITSNKKSNFTYDIIPIMVSDRRKRSTGEFKNFEHGILKRSIDKQPLSSAILPDQQEIKDYIIVDDPEIPVTNRQNSKGKTKGSSGPLVYNVETLVVTDHSIYETHKTFIKSTNNNTIFQHMRIYFSYLINGVNQRYQNTLGNDPDLRINIKLTNFLFLTTQEESNWTNPSIVGVSGYPTYEGNQVVLASSGLDNFRNYMNSKTFPFTYDHAMALLKKDLWGGTTTSDSSVAGLAYVAAVCGSYRYSISEEFGGFTGLVVIAHEMGHNLGLNHDGVSPNLDCPTTDYYIMTPVLSYSKISNIQRFSTCSIAQFKSRLITSGSPTNLASCLQNTDFILPSEVSNSDSSLTGQNYNLNDQCKMVYGNDASFCQSSSFISNICSNLYCRKNSNESLCYSNAPAADGSTCGSGKMCISGNCTTSPVAAVSSCPFGDDLVTNNTLQVILPSYSVPCAEFLRYLNSSSISISYFCSTSYAKSKCCQSCLKYNSLSCTDSYTNCPSLSCASNRADCCASCLTDPLRCSNETFLCQNGGKCNNITVSANQKFGFNCSCPTGYSGDLCEIVTQCSTNPCLNGGTCYTIGTIGFSCRCTAAYSGKLCSIATTTLTTTTLTTTISTMTTRSTTTVTTTTTRQITTTTTRNILGNVSADVFSLLNGLYPNMARENPQNIVYLNSNLQKFVEFLDNITTTQWTSNCFLGDQYYKFLEKRFIDEKSSWVTFERLSKALRCKRDCNFDRLIAANFSNDNANFSKTVASRLDPEISKLCLTSLKNWLPLPPPMPLNQTLNFTQILSYTNNGQLPISSIFKPFQLSNIPPSQTLQVLSTFGNSLDLDSARAIGQNVPLNTNLSNVLAATCCVRIEIINSASPSFLAQNIANMGINNIDDNRKAQIANLVAKSRSPDDIKNLLLNGDQKMASAISIETLNNLSISMDNIPDNKLPPAYIQQAAQTEIANKNILDVSETKLARFLPGLSPSVINKIPDNDKKNSVVKIMNASSSAVKPLTIVQRSALFNVILGDIVKLPTPAEQIFQFENLDSSTVKAISELIVAAPASVLNSISQSSKFIDVIYENAKISSSKCCSFSKASRDTYAQYAIKYLVNDPAQMTVSHLDTLGPCFAPNIPFEYLNRLSGSDIYTKISYFATSSFQPNSNISTLIGQKLRDYYTNTKTSLSDKAQFISEIKGLVVFLNETNSNVYSSQVETVSNQIKSERDLTDSNVQKCRVGTVDDGSIKELIKNVNKAIILSVIPSSLLSGAKATNSLTCSQLNSISNTLNLLSGTAFYEMDNTEFQSCLQLLGKPTNNFDSTQLTKLADKVKLNYPDLSSISDTTISSINNILTAFSSNDLNQLNISSIAAVQTLGAISTWSSSQANVLVQRISQKFALDSNNLPSILNLVCGLTQTQINNIINSEFKSSIGVLSTLTLDNCDSIQYLYNKAKTAYSLTSISSTYLTEFGSVSAGISIADLKTLIGSDFNSFSLNALKIMPASTVNSFSQDNLSGLDLDQVSTMKNGPNYASYSSYVQNSLQAVATNSDLPKAGTDTTTSGSIIKSSSNLITISLKNVLIASLLALLAYKL